MSRTKITTASAIFKSAAVILGLLIAIGGIALVLNWTFLRRIFTYPDNPITDVDWYQPRETVKGNVVKLPEAQPTIDRSTLNKISAYARSADSSALLVMHRGELVLEQYWQGFKPTSTFNSMSMSKTITALLTGIAIEEGQIESEITPVANYISEWQGHLDRITVRDLLYMQSGLRNWDSKENPTSDLIRMYASPDADAVALKIPAKRPPQQAFNYNNANTQILSKVIERATGIRYAEYLQNKLWQPLQANDAFLWLDRSNGNPKAFCCLFATPRDWAKVGQLFLDRGQVNGKQIVSAEWLDKMQQPSSLNPQYGYHLWLKARTDNKSEFGDRDASQPFTAEDIFYLDGASKQRVYIIPSQELVIVRIGEQPRQWDDSVIPNTLVESLQLNN